MSPICKTPAQAAQSGPIISPAIRAKPTAFTVPAAFRKRGASRKAKRSRLAELELVHCRLPYKTTRLIKGRANAEPTTSRSTALTLGRLPVQSKKAGYLYELIAHFQHRADRPPL
jgi:hypothetical protein